LAATVAPRQTLDLDRKRRQIGILDQRVEAKAQRFRIHAGKFADPDAHRQHVRIMPRGFGADGLQHGTGYAYLVHGSKAFLRS